MNIEDRLRQLSTQKAAEVKQRLSEMLIEISQLGVGLIKKDLNIKGRGRKYKRGNKTHIASLPGKPPNIDTGLLINAISGSANGYKEATVSVKNLGGLADYALALEYGTSKMAARPYFWKNVSKLKRVLRSWIKSEDWSI